MSSYFTKGLVKAMVNQDMDQLELLIDEFARDLMSVPGDRPTISLEDLKRAIMQHLLAEVQGAEDTLRISHLDFEPSGETE